MRGQFPELTHFGRPGVIPKHLRTERRRAVIEGLKIAPVAVAPVVVEMGPRSKRRLTPSEIVVGVAAVAGAGLPVFFGRANQNPDNGQTAGEVYGTFGSFGIPSGSTSKRSCTVGAAGPRNVAAAGFTASTARHSTGRRSCRISPASRLFDTASSAVTASCLPPRDRLRPVTVEIRTSTRGGDDRFGCGGQACDSRAEVYLRFSILLGDEQAARGAVRTLVLLARLRIGIPRQTLSTEGVGATALAPPAIIGGLHERRTSPVELLWDLVFVFAVTQVTTLIASDLTWAGFGHGDDRARARLVGVVGVRVGGERGRGRVVASLRAILLPGCCSSFVAGSRCRRRSPARRRCSR